MYELFNLKRIVVFGREVTTAWKVETAANEDFGEDPHERQDWARREQAEIWDEMGEVLDAQEF